ncbi:MAG: methyl-accepting chemotaxis protein [Bacillota bacterium]
MNLAIIGAGKGGTSIIESFRKTDDVNIVLVVDRDLSADGIQLARKYNIPCSQSIADIKGTNVDIIIEATGNDTVKKLVEETCGSQCRIIDSQGAYLIMTLVERNIHFLEKMNGQISAVKNAAAIIQDRLDEISCSIGDTHTISEKLLNFTNTSSKYIEESDTIIKYVNSIASQIKILGINATIEAARAGEHGRGFTVVAKEVQNLANNSESFAKEINTILGKLSHEIKNVVQEVDQLKQLTNTQIKASDHVQNAVDHLVDQMA